MPPNTIDGSAFSFTSLKGHTTHISILWVFVLFCFITVAVVSLGGQQKGLVERQFPDTKVHGDLDVLGGVASKSSLVGFTGEVDTTGQTVGFTAQYGRIHLLGLSAAAAAAPGSAITLPAPREGEVIKFITVADQVEAGIGFTIGTAANPGWATGSMITQKVVGMGANSVNPGGLVPIPANNTFVFQNNQTGNNGGGGGRSSVFDLLGVKENGVDRWLIQGFSANRLDTSERNTSAFATA